MKRKRNGNGDISQNSVYEEDHKSSPDKGKLEILVPFYSSGNSTYLTLMEEVNLNEQNQDIKSNPQDQYYAKLNSVDLVFRLEKVIGDGSCMFLSNGITREYWVNFLQRCYNYLTGYEIEKFNLFCSVIRDDIFTMFENDFALCDSDEKAIENKKTLYDTLYKKQFNNSVSSPYSELVDAFLAGKKTGNWLSFNKMCTKFETLSNHLELYRCDSFEKLKLWPSLKLMTAFASLRHQFKDSSGVMSYHVIWQQNQEGNKQLSLLYPTVEELASWLKSNKTMHHSVFHISSVHFNKLILTKYNFGEKLPKSPEIKIVSDKDEESDDDAMDDGMEDVVLQQAIRLSLKNSDEQDLKEESKKNHSIEYSQNESDEDNFNLAIGLSLSEKNLNAGSHPPFVPVTSIFLNTMHYGLLVGVINFLNYRELNIISTVSKFLYQYIVVDSRYCNEKYNLNQLKNQISESGSSIKLANNGLFSFKKEFLIAKAIDGVEQKLFTMEEILSLPKNEKTLILLSTLLSNDKARAALKKKLFTLEELLPPSVIFFHLEKLFLSILLSDLGIQVLEEKLMTAKDISELLLSNYTFSHQGLCIQKFNIIFENQLRLDPLVKTALRDGVINFKIVMENGKRNNGYVNQGELKAIIIQKQRESENINSRGYSR